MKSFILLNFIIYFIIISELNAVRIGPIIIKSTTTWKPTTSITDTSITTTTQSPLTTPKPDPNPKKDVSNSIILNIILNGSSINNSTIILNYTG
ncbi:hypothetical protein WA026_022699 [Henosepilachna vigintioctopunctata]|uniref:Uncharacterized protein n=1 Tax=Henosepilachna vigintioctopunctata TaxID=420089 RepID=A0AAW1TZC4_9CUCU